MLSEKQPMRKKYNFLRVLVLFRVSGVPREKEILGAVKKAAAVKEV